MHPAFRCGYNTTCTIYWRRTQVVRERSAKPLCIGSNPIGALIRGSFSPYFSNYAQEALQHGIDEGRILLHLAGKIDRKQLDYRPTPKQRSTIELLRYLVVMGPMIVRGVKAG